MPKLFLTANLETPAIDQIDGILFGATSNGAHMQLPEFALVEFNFIDQDPKRGVILHLLHPNTRPETGAFEIAYTSVRQDGQPGVLFQRFLNDQEISLVSVESLGLWPTGVENLVEIITEVELYLQDMLNGDYTPQLQSWIEVNSIEVTDSEPVEA